MRNLTNDKMIGVESFVIRAGLNMSSFDNFESIFY